MIRRLSLVALALLLAVPAAIHAQDNLTIRVDRSTNAADPDDVPDVTVTPIPGGIEIHTGPAAVLFDENATASGEYTLSGTFTLLEPSSHTNYYGLIYGGSDLQSDSQNYMYFLIGQDGTYIIKHRANSETVHDIMGRTAHDAIATPGDDGTSVNDLEVRIGAEQIDFVINGQVVHSTENSGMAGRTDGIYGVRINHVIPGVRVENLTVSN